MALAKTSRHPLLLLNHARYDFRVPPLSVFFLAHLIDTYTGACSPPTVGDVERVKFDTHTHVRVKGTLRRGETATTPSTKYENEKYGMPFLAFGLMQCVVFFCFSAFRGGNSRLPGTRLPRVRAASRDGVEKGNSTTPRV